MENKEIIDLRLSLKKGDPLYKTFFKIKEAIGIKNNSEVLRFILKQVSKISFSDFSKIEILTENPPQEAS